MEKGDLFKKKKGRERRYFKEKRGKRKMKKGDLLKREKVRERRSISQGRRRKEKQDPLSTGNEGERN